MKIVLQKFISQSGFCSRRQAEELIRSGKVLVNGQPAELGMKADIDDEIKIGNKIIGLPKEKIYIKFNKPRGYTCTTRKFKGEKNIFDLIKIDERLIIAGRLDKESRGLVLLTNDGELVQKITHPSFGHEKEYETTINNSQPASPAGGLTVHNIKNIIKKIKEGVDIGEGDGIARVKEIKYLGTSESLDSHPAIKAGYADPSYRRQNGFRHKFTLILTEGKKRQIRRIFKALNLEVVDLVRTRIDNLKLGGLKEGAWEYIKI